MRRPPFPPLKPCAFCGDLMPRKVYGYSKETPSQYRLRMFCSVSCAVRAKLLAQRKYPDRCFHGQPKGQPCLPCDRVERRAV